jgi:hypothetical protein
VPVSLWSRATRLWNIKVIGVLILDESDEQYRREHAVPESEIDEIIGQLRLRELAETGLNLMIAGEAIQRHIHGQAVDGDLLVIKRLARQKGSRGYRRLMNAIADATERGPQGIRTAHRIIQRATTLMIAQLPDFTTAKRKFEEMVLEIGLEGTREEDKCSVEREALVSCAD